MKTDFLLDSTIGKKVSLEDFLGENLVLYFYPKDNTSGCTTEAIEFSELYSQFREEDTEIVGISRDSIKTHINFKTKHNIVFQLLSDPNREIHGEYDVLKNKKMYGKDVIGTVRSTFVFDKKGKLVKEFRNVKAKDHAEQVLNFIREELNDK